MPLIKPSQGYTVEKLAEILGNMIKGGHGNLIVMLDLDGKVICPAGRGDIGIASDGRKVLVIRRGGMSEQQTDGVLRV